jgi:hypothetical protein
MNESNRDMFEIERISISALNKRLKEKYQEVNEIENSELLVNNQLIESYLI